MKIILTSPFGAKENFRNHPHYGVDIAMQPGTPLKAVEEGIIHLADYGNANAGKTVFLETEHGTFIYGHLSDFLVKEGQKVSKGQEIALSGNTGHVYGDGHLHLGLKVDGEYQNPTHFADAAVNGKTWLQKFIDKGQIDSYNHAGKTLPEFVQGIAVENFIILGAIFLLLWNKYTRPYTVGTVILILLLGV